MEDTFDLEKLVEQAKNISPVIGVEKCTCGAEFYQHYIQAFSVYDILECPYCSEDGTTLIRHKLFLDEDS